MNDLERKKKKGPRPLLSLKGDPVGEKIASRMRYLRLRMLDAISDKDIAELTIKLRDMAMAGDVHSAKFIVEMVVGKACDFEMVDNKSSVSTTGVVGILDALPADFFDWLKERRDEFLKPKTSAHQEFSASRPPMENSDLQISLQLVPTPPKAEPEPSAQDEAQARAKELDPDYDPLPFGPGRMRS